MNILKRWAKLPLGYLERRISTRLLRQLEEPLERSLLAQGKLLANWTHGLQNITSLESAEFRIFSQFGDDGIIQYLTSHLAIESKSLIEFGVENFAESNGRFLMMNNNWSAFVMDGDEENIRELRQAHYYWRHDLVAETAFITVENIDSLLARRSFAEVGLLHIDLDGNDYWIWEAITGIRPAIVIVEYNSVFGVERALTIPYAKDFQRLKSHHSGLYWGASLRALTLLAARKGYAFVGSNSAGNNAYFVRQDCLNDAVKRVSVEQGYRVSKYRESRDEHGKLNYMVGADRLRLIRGLPVFNVETKQIENL